MADGLAAARGQTPWDDMTNEKAERQTDRKRDRGGGKVWSRWTGFPRFPLPRIPSSSGLCQLEACPGTFLNTDFNHQHSPPLTHSLCPHNTSPPLPCHSRQWIKGLVYNLQQSKQCWAEGNTSWRQLPATAGGQFVRPEVQDAEQETGLTSIHTEHHALIKGAFTASTFTMFCLTEPISKLRSRSGGFTQTSQPSVARHRSKSWSLDRLLKLKKKKKRDKSSAVTMATWITKPPWKQAFHEVKSKFTKNNCYAISKTTNTQTSNTETLNNQSKRGLLRAFPGCTEWQQVCNTSPNEQVQYGETMWMEVQYRCFTVWQQLQDHTLTTSEWPLTPVGAHWSFGYIHLIQFKTEALVSHKPLSPQPSIILVLFDLVFFISDLFYLDLRQGVLLWVVDQPACSHRKSGFLCSVSLIRHTTFVTVILKCKFAKKINIAAHRYTLRFVFI